MGDTQQDQRSRFSGRRKSSYNWYFFSFLVYTYNSISRTPQHLNVSIIEFWVVQGETGSASLPFLLSCHRILNSLSMNSSSTVESPPRNHKEVVASLLLLHRQELRNRPQWHRAPPRSCLRSNIITKVLLDRTELVMVRTMKMSMMSMMFFYRLENWLPSSASSCTTSSMSLRLILYLGLCLYLSLCLISYLSLPK